MSNLKIAIFGMQILRFQNLEISRMKKYWNFENWHAHLYIQYSLCLILILKFKDSDCRTSKFLRLCLNQVLKFQNYRCATLNYQYFAYQMLVKKRQYHCMLALLKLFGVPDLKFQYSASLTMRLQYLARNFTWKFQYMWHSKS